MKGFLHQVSLYMTYCFNVFVQRFLFGRVKTHLEVVADKQMHCQEENSAFVDIKSSVFEQCIDRDKSAQSKCT